jgi:hypothetical protein
MRVMGAPSTPVHTAVCQAIDLSADTSVGQTGHSAVDFVSLYLAQAACNSTIPRRTALAARVHRVPTNARKVTRRKVCMYVKPTEASKEGGAKAYALAAWCKEL